MSVGVSELQFWKKGSNQNNNSEKDGGEFLSYNVFMGLSVLGGYFGLDHLYLRSPLTFIAKLLVNVLFFGVWWIYDATQAVFNTDIIKIYGLGVPGLGPKGIASGVLASDTPGKYHLRFLIYSLCLFFGGIIGLDSFVVGDNTSGIIRLLCCVTMIFIPISMAWWAYQLYMYFFNTKTTINRNSRFFGGVGGDDRDSFIDAWIKQRLKPIETVLAPLTGIVALGDKAIKTASMLGEQAHGIVEAVSSASKLSAVKSIHDATSEGVKAAKGSTAATATPTATATAATDKGKSEGVSLGNAMKEFGNISAFANTAKDAMSKIDKGVIENIASKAMSGAKDEVKDAAKEEKEEKEEKEPGQAGGYISKQDSLNSLPYVLIATLAFISVGGFCTTVYRTRINNVRAAKNDAPPEPGVSGKFDSKKSV